MRFGRQLHFTHPQHPVFYRASGLRTVLVSLAAAMMLYSGYLPATETPATTTFELSVRDRLLTLKADTVPLIDVLRAIGLQSNISMKFSGDLSAPVSRSFANVPVRKAVRQLAKDALLVMIYEPKIRDHSLQRLSEIRVYGATDGNPPVVLMNMAGPKSQTVVTDSSSQRVEASENVVTANLQAIRQSDKAARRVMIHELSSRGDVDSVATLGRLVAEDGDSGIRTEAVTALYEIGTKEAVAAMQTGLGDIDYTVRGKVVDALGDLGGEQALMGLGQVLFTEQETDLRLRAVNQLARDLSEPARALLEAAANRDQDIKVRNAARRALGLQ